MTKEEFLEKAGVKPLNSDLIAVKKNGIKLKFIEDQTPEICLAAVRQNGWALKHVKDQTEEMCLIAVDQDWRALEYARINFDKESKELTVSEISDLLGYEVKIVK